jgi:hypothetical protein
MIFLEIQKLNFRSSRTLLIFSLLNLWVPWILGSKIHVQKSNDLNQYANSTIESSSRDKRSLIHNYGGAVRVRTYYN